MLIVLGSSKLKKIVSDAVETTIREAEGTFKSLTEMRKTLATMEVEQAKKQEGWDRREREIEHKVGLERKRQEFEIEQSKREATVSVQTQNLEADKQRFKSEMDFQRKHLEAEVASLRELVNQMLKRLPSAEIITNIESKHK